MAPWPVIAERAAQQSARLEDLIQQLLLLAKADEHQLAVQQHPVNLRALLHDVAAATPAPDIEIDVDVDSYTATIGNPEHLQRLFRNIVDNAVRYARTRVLITATSTAEEVRIEIDDDGPGIPGADRERVFDRFVRLDNSRERSTGTSGLGLAIAREIARAHGGHLAIEDSSSGGTRMIITRLPASNSAPPTRHSPAVDAR
jgi:signal transduction histidine kinase